MSRFIELHELRRELHGHGPSPAWYFPDAKLVRKGNSASFYWEYSIQSGYPMALHSHFRHLGVDHRRDETHGLLGARRRVEIRRWIERHLDGDVMHEIDDRSYVLPSHQTISHGYHVFHLQSEANANHCLMRFAELFEVPTEYDENDELTQRYWRDHGHGREQKFYKLY